MCYFAPTDPPLAKQVGSGTAKGQRQYYTGDYLVYECFPNATLANILPNTMFKIDDDIRAPPSITAIKCQNGAWSASPVCQPKGDEPATCGPIPKLNENVVILTAEGVVGSPPSRNFYSRINDYLQLDCMPGFELDGEDRVFCRGDGTWSVSPSCVAITCGLAPETPERAIVLFKSFKDMSVTDDFVLYKCSSGYRLADGPDRHICNKTGQWSSPAPRCQRIIAGRNEPLPTVSCRLPPPIPVEATLVYSSFDNRFDGRPVIGDFSVYACPDGFSVMGNSTVKCLLGGQWSRASPCTVGGGGTGYDYYGGNNRGVCNILKFP